MFYLCSFTHAIVFCLLFISLWPVPVSAEVLGLAYYECLREAGTSTSDTLVSSSTFKENLNSALGNLTSLAVDLTTGFAVASVDSESLCFSTSQNLASYGAHCADGGSISALRSGALDTAYAMFQCRGDQGMDGCAVCVANATVRLSQSLCPSYVGARIQLDGCYIRYDNQISIFKPDFGHVREMCYVETNDAAALSTIDFVLNVVTTQAPKENGYASVSAQNENALAQCLGYLTESECSQCLKSYNHTTGCGSALGGQIHLVSCYYRYENYSFFTPSPGTPLALGAPSASSSKQGSKVGVIAGSVGGAVFAMVCLALYCRYGQRICRIRLQVKNVTSQLLFEPRAVIYSLHDLEVATQGFHLSNKLGAGAFGSVYKGTLQNGTEIAAKRLSRENQQGKQTFMNEVRLITSFQHKNLIKLLGCCVEDPEQILVYEYLPNGSLSELLFGDSNNSSLDWDTRHGIILGMAQGLAYLHEESQVHIIHRDIKPSNILLDDQFKPVIGDFGLARLVSDYESHINSSVAGTMGYVAPEYMAKKELTNKVDVYSFGVVTLEIITGKENFSEEIVRQIWMLYQYDRQMELVDPKLGNSFPTEKVMRTMHIALLCVQETPRLRPTMSSVRFLLSGDSSIEDKPTKPAFVGSASSGFTNSTSFA